VKSAGLTELTKKWCSKESLLDGEPESQPDFSGDFDGDLSGNMSGNLDGILMKGTVLCCGRFRPQTSV